MYTCVGITLWQVASAGHGWLNALSRKVLAPEHKVAKTYSSRSRVVSTISVIRARRAGRPLGVLIAAGCLVHAAVNGEGIDQADKGEEPGHLGLCRGQHHLTSGVPGVLAGSGQRCHAAGVDEPQACQIDDDLWPAGHDFCERCRDICGVGYVKFPAQRDDNLTFVFAGTQIHSGHGEVPSCLLQQHVQRKKGFERRLHCPGSSANDQVRPPRG